MMKPGWMMAAVVVFVVVAGRAGAASSEEVMPGMANKFLHGVVNTFTGVIELPMQVRKGYERGIPSIASPGASKAAGTVLGFFRGITHAAGRTAHGAVDTLFFWTANSPDNVAVGIPLDAEFAWQQGTRYSIFEPSLGQGLTPYPRKLVRGVVDGVTGILEVPGQIEKVSRLNDPFVKTSTGVAKGCWFWFSRTITGVSDAVLFLLPNPAEQYGYGFEEDWAWGALAGDKEHK